MKLSDLIRYGVPDSIIKTWQSRQGDYLLPLQEKAIREGLLSIDDTEQSPNLLISAPTSSGKSFCGELAAIVSLLKRRKAIMLLPLKSIAEEKYNYFREGYHDIGINVLIATGDHPENDADFELGNFDLALAIYEKFNRLLTINSDILQQIGTIVIDELQMIAEPKRGYELEMALTKTMNSDYNPRLVALSAVIDDSTELAGWLNCRPVSETVRPVDLWQGVAADGQFHFRSFNSGREGHEKIAISNDRESLAENLMEYLKHDKGQKLVFLSSRRATIEAAFQLASSSSWPAAKTALGRLEGEENSFLMRSLRQTLSRGVAFHNADLTPSQRQAIEQGYRDGEISVIFSTTTLAMGVNLPAETVLLETMKYSSGAFGRRPSLVPITVGEFRNITGRAGRFGISKGDCPGRAVVLAQSEFEFDVLWSEYIDTQKKEKLASTLLGHNLHDTVLDLIVSGYGKDINQLEKVFSGSWCAKEGNLAESIDLDDIIEGLISLNLVTRARQPAPPGEAVAQSGISIKSACHYLKLLDKKYPRHLHAWLFLALSGADFEILQAGLSASEYRSRAYEKMLCREYNEYISDINDYIDFKIGREPLDFRTSAILKAMFLLTDWADGLPVERLEQRYQLHHGQIIHLGETAAWLLVSLARLIHAVDCNSSTPSQLEKLSFGVQFGINPAMKDLYLLFSPPLNRMDMKSLEEHDINSLSDFYKIDKKQLTEIFQPENKLNNLIKKMEDIKKEDNMHIDMQSHRTGRHICLGNHAPGHVELDGTYERERYLVKIDGFPVRLTGKSFKYLAKLVFSRLLNRDGWIYKDDIEVGFNQARYLYRLKQEMKSGGVSWPIFENNRLGYYRLDLDPSKIRLNHDNLKDHYDFELRQMAQEANLKAVS